MSRITDQLMENAWNRVSNASASPEKLAELMDRFGEEQADVVEFVSEVSSGWGDDAKDLVFHAALVIWLSFGAAAFVKTESLIRCFEKCSAWLDEQQGEAILLQKKLSDFSRFSEPELMRFAVELVFEANEDGLEIEPEEQQELLVVLKTLIDAFAE